MLQDATVSVSQSQLSAVSLKTEVELGEHTSLSGLTGVSVITTVPSGKVELAEGWKRLETNDWQTWKEEVSEQAAASIPAHCSDSRAVGSATVTAEPVMTLSSTEVCDMRQIKTEQGLNYSSVGSASSSELRASRIVASVAPCTPVQLNERLSPWKVPLPSHPHPPPLLHSTSHDQSATSPLPTSVIQSPVVIDDTLTLSPNDSDDSEQELRNRSPSPEPRLSNEECHRSKNAVYVTIICIFFEECVWFVIV